MRRRQVTLRRMLADAGCVHGQRPFLRPSSGCRGAGPPGTWIEIERIYRALGGTSEACPLQPGSWDIELADVAVELDEEQHFNRYRALTLESRLYRDSPFLAGPYSSYCQRYESDCLRKASNRGYWLSPSSMAQFGPASSPGDLSPPGSPRWKQRAFYDFLKDLAPVLTGTPVARIAIWDEVRVDGSCRLIRDVLDEECTAAVPAVIGLVAQRSGGAIAV
jgi:hypothetical protein